MQRFSLGLALALFAGVGLFNPWCSAQARPAGDHVLAIGVIRTGEIMRNMAEMKKFQTDGRARLTELQQQQQQRELELQDLQKHRDNNLKQGSQQWVDETSKIDTKTAELNIWKQVSSMQLERWQKTTVKEMYDHVAAATAQVAEAQHLDLVIADESPEIGPDMDKVSSAQLEAALASRAVLFANKKADITQDVLTQVDANFAKQGSIAGPPPIPAPAGTAH